MSDIPGPRSDAFPVWVRAQALTAAKDTVAGWSQGFTEKQVVAVAQTYETYLLTGKLPPRGR